MPIKIRNPAVWLVGFLINQTCLSFILLTFFSSEKITAETRKDLARVAILTFTDETETKNYDYLPQSLTDAIDKSLQNKFEYLREDPVESAIKRAAFSEERAFTPEQATAFARTNNFDFVVYGSFTLDRKTRKIIVTTNVATGLIEKFRRLKERQNNADATIISLTEKVADDIVAEMTDVAKSQAAGDANTTAGTKMEIRKETVTSWDAKKWYLAADGGITGSLVGQQNTKEGSGFALHLNREIWKRAYIGAEVAYGRIQSFGPTCTGPFCVSYNGNDFSSINSAGVLGYALYPWNRWRIFADVGAGIAIGSFREDTQSGKVDENKFFVRLSGGIDFLIISGIGIGAGLRIGTMPFTSGYNFAYAQPHLRVIYCF